MQERFKISVQRSCRLSLLQPSVWYAKSQARDQSGLRLRIREIAMDRPRFGYLRVLVMLKREGWADPKRVRQNAVRPTSERPSRLQLKTVRERGEGHQLEIQAENPPRQRGNSNYNFNTSS